MLAGNPPVTDTTKYDQLDDANQIVGAADDAVGNGEGVSSFNGNLMVTHPSSPVLPQDGNLSLALGRTYNSHNVRKYKVRDGSGYKELMSGRSWIGLGWTSHVGRIFRRAKYTENADSTWNYDVGYTYFEFPNGSRYQGPVYRFEPSVKQAQPNLKIVYYRDCVNYTPPPPCSICNTHPTAACCEPQDACEGRASDPVEHYDVTFPDGTLYRLEKLVGYQYLSATNKWVTNHDRAGYYTTKITDVHGNVVHVEYWGSQNPNYPEAIKRIWSDRYTDMEINTTLCGNSDCGAASGTTGLLKEVRTTGFKGSRATPQETRYQFFYEIVSVTDTDGTQQLPVLVEVKLVGSDGSLGGSVKYGHGVGRSLGNSVTTFGPLLDRITYPLGAVSEYRYGQWFSGSRDCGPHAATDRSITGVVRRTVYPEGLNPDGSITNKPHSSRLWTREFRKNPLVGPGQPAAINSYEEMGPDGRRTTWTVSGAVCGETDAQAGPHGVRKETKIYEGDPAVVLRTQTLIYDWQTDPDGDIIKSLGQTIETVFNDDTGVCFESTGTEINSAKLSFRDRDGSSQWRLILENSDSYMPMRANGRLARVSYTHFVGPPACGDGSTKHIVGLSDFRYVEEGKGENRRYEENFSFDCKGNPLSVTLENGWQYAGTVTDPATATATNINSTTDTNDVTRSFAYDAAKGNLTQVSYSGGHGYPDLSPTNSYSRSFTWDRGVAVTQQVSGLGYRATDLTADPGGQIASSRDPNGLETSFDYDALGRLTVADPPGATEHKTRLVYPDLSHIRVITSGGVETTFDAARDDQLFEERELDGLGRVRQVWRAMPDGTKSTQVVRFDQFGRVIFSSEWMTELDYSNAPKQIWESGDIHGSDGIRDYRVDGIPKKDSRPWGTVTFYGKPSTSDPGNPLQAQPDGLGRIRRIERADGSAMEYEYCGPHVQTKIIGVRTSLTDPQYQDAITRSYYDALGRLVLVDAPAGSADAEYRYDPRGNLERVNLLAQLPSDPYEAWRQGQLATGQVREFKYDATARLARSQNPESGRQETGTIGADGNADKTYYDAIGNLLVYQDELGLQRGYFFKNTFDIAGRLTKAERIRGTPSVPQTSDIVRLGTDGGFESGMGSWVEGTISGNTFTVSDSFWRRVTYGQASCLTAPPGQTSSNAALYFGETPNCSYANAPQGAQAVRRLATGVTRDDVLTLKFWRQVREGSGDRDAFQVYVVESPPGGTNSMSARRIALRLDESQSSFARWQQSYEVRPADLFTVQEWAEGATKDLYLYLVFEKGDTAQSGIGTGLLVDDVFLGRRGVEKLAESVYDTDTCSGTPTAGGEACLEGVEPTNQFKGKAAQVLSYQDGSLISKQSLVYKGLNGRLSGERRLTDWTLDINWADFGDVTKPQPQEFVSRYAYDAQGPLSSWAAPYQPGKDSARRYDYRYKRGYLDGLFATGGLEFLKPGANPPALDYTAAGSVEAIRFTNEAKTDYAADKMYRPSSVTVTGPALGGGTQSLWSSGGYAYDGAQNISGIGGIGGQKFAYDLSQRLTRAQVLTQATNPADAVAYDISYGYDSYGNMTSRTWQHAGQSPPSNFVLNFSYSSATNQIQDPNFKYDPNGDMTRFTVSSGGSMAGLWDPRGRLTAVYAGTPEQQSSPIERYAYDASGLRLVRLPESGDGKPIIALRGGLGRAVSEFVADPALGRPKLAREHLYGDGLLLVERKVVENFPTMTASSPTSLNNSFGFDLQDPPGSGTYAADIRTPDGYLNHITGIAPDLNGVFWIPESAFAAAKSNWVRVRKESQDAEPYSNATTVAFDPSVTAQSANQVRAISVSRNGTQVIVRWSLLLPNGKKTKIHFTRRDTGSTVPINPQGLAPGITEFSLDAQALASPCGYFSLTQTNLDGSGGTGQSVGSDLPGPGGIQDLEPTQPGCDSPAPPPPSAGYSFADAYHHRDHLGTLRVVTDAGGWKYQAHDYYPFGREVLPSGANASEESSKRYTGHERDFSTDLDYMVMREKPVNYGSFLSADSARDVSLGAPFSWNKYAYVRDNPIGYVDPLGEMINRGCPSER